VFSVPLWLIKQFHYLQQGALWSMTIQFSQPEIEAIKRYFDKVASGETQKQLNGLDQEFPEWNTIFLLLRKLLAYGIHSGVPIDQGFSYKELQTGTQKSRDMLLNVHAYTGKFENLLAAYEANH
jgi:hypothetical protein